MSKLLFFLKINRTGRGKNMILMLLGLLILLTPIRGKGKGSSTKKSKSASKKFQEEVIEAKFREYFERESKREYTLEDDDAPDPSEEEKARGEIASSIEDVLNLEDVCDSFFYDFGFDICEFEGGWRRRNRWGRYLVTLLADKKRDTFDLFPNITRNHRRAFRGANFNKNRNLATCSIQGNFYHKYEYHGDMFKKSVRFLVAVPNFKAKDIGDVIESLTHLNYCSEGKLHFELQTHFIPVDVSGKNWMTATYEVMDEAAEMGIEFNQTRIYSGSDERYTFNTAKHLTMIILPDDVDFYGSYGFAALHHGLSVLTMNAAKEEILVLHEMGHNLGMMHSSSIDEGEYGDDRCIMGDTRQKGRCFNGPKSYYLGLYTDYTAVITGETLCNVAVTLADVDDHLSDKNSVLKKYGDYYVILAVKIPFDKKVEPIYMMYYKDSNIVTVTTGGIGKMTNTNGDKLLFSDVSQRLTDLKKDESIVISGVLIKRCSSSGVAKVLVSFLPNAPNEC